MSFTAVIHSCHAHVSRSPRRPWIQVCGAIVSCQDERPGALRIRGGWRGGQCGQSDSSGEARRPRRFTAVGEQAVVMRITLQVKRTSAPSCDLALRGRGPGLSRPSGGRVERRRTVNPART